MIVVNTPLGLFQYTMGYPLPRPVMDRILQGLPVACYLDDILVAGKSKQEHNQLLEQVLKRLSQCGIHLQKEMLILPDTSGIPGSLY